MADRNPQARQMADESMVRNLAAQARAIWPQEQPLLERYGLPRAAAILDLGCGTGEVSVRMAELFPDARVIGVDLEATHLNSARQRTARFGLRAGFLRGDAYQLSFADATFDLSVNRHMLQAVPEAWRIIAEMARVTKPGGRLHVLAEDYAMMHFWPVNGDSDGFWREGPMTYAARTGTDLRVGRKVFTWMRELGLADVRVDYVTLDTVRVERETFALIWEAWRDGYTNVIADNSDLTRQQVWDAMTEMMQAIRNPDGYGVWHIPIITGVVPSA